MRLPIPIFSIDKIYTDIEFVKPKNKVLADAYKFIKHGEHFNGMLALISGCTESLESNDGHQVTDKLQIKTIIRRMPYRSAEWVGVSIMLQTEDDDGIEGVYRCPRCQHQIISEIQYDSSGEIVSDTRDFISNLPIKYMEDYERFFTIDFTNTVTIKRTDTQEILQEVESIELEHPTLAHCITAYSKIGSSDQIRLQNQIYVEALSKYNRIEADKKWKVRMGMLVFENIEDVKKDMRAIGDKIEEYGLDARAEKRCNNCQKIWKANINTNYFFANALVE